MFIKKTLNQKIKKKKKCPCLFNKKTPLYVGLGSKQKKHLATAKQLIRKNSAHCLKRTDRLDLPPLPLFVLVRFLRSLM